MRKLLTLLFTFSFHRLAVALCIGGSLLAYVSNAQQSSLTYSIRLRVQAKDTSQYCGCPQDDNTQDYGATADCNSLGQVMINVYTDTTLLRTYFTDQTGYCTNFSLPYGKYRLVFHARSYSSATVLVDFTAPDKRNRIVATTGTQLHYRSDNTANFICIMLDGSAKKNGVRIIQKN